MSSGKNPSKKKKMGGLPGPAETGPIFEEDQEYQDNEQPLLAKNIYDSHGKGKNMSINSDRR